MPISKASAKSSRESCFPSFKGALKEPIAVVWRPILFAWRGRAPIAVLMPRNREC